MIAVRNSRRAIGSQLGHRPPSLSSLAKAKFVHCRPQASFIDVALAFGPNEDIRGAKQAHWIFILISKVVD